MLLTVLQSLFKRDLDKLASEIDAYASEQQLWVVDGQIPNSGGTLCLHLIGNLNAFIGAELGNTGYIRQRELEFSLKNVPKADLLKQIKATQQMVAHTLGKIPEDTLDKEYPIVVFKEPMTTGYFLTHLATHLSYHLGQVNYHRRILGC